MLKKFPYQSCPICKGLGSTKSYLGSNIEDKICKSCAGTGIIPEAVIPQITTPTYSTPGLFTEDRVRKLMIWTAGMSAGKELPEILEEIENQLKLEKCQY